MIHIPESVGIINGWLRSILLKVKGLKSTEQAMHLLETGEHLWIRGIENVLIYVHRLGEASYRICVCSVECVTTRFSVKRLSVDAKVDQMEAYRLVKKLGARPCKVVKNSLVDELEKLSETCGAELSYHDFVNAVKGLGLRVQVNP